MPKYLDLNGLGTYTTEVEKLIDTKASINNPSFTGTPTSPTPANNNNSTQVATTAFVRNALATSSLAGTVMSSSANNKISVAADGTMSVNSVSAEKLTQDDNSYIIFDCGTASTVI